MKPAGRKASHKFVVANTRSRGGKVIARKRHETEAGKTSRAIFSGKRVERKRF